MQRNSPHYAARLNALNECRPRRSNRNVGVGDSTLLDSSQGLGGKVLHPVGEDSRNAPLCGLSRILEGIHGPDVDVEASIEHLMDVGLGQVLPAGVDRSALNLRGLAPASRAHFRWGA